MNENEIISILRRQFGRPGRGLLRGIGDDAAVFSAGRSSELWLVTTDLLLEDVHFKRAWISPGDLGHKALAVNLSDIAAMGAAPRYYCVSLGLPKETSISWITRFYRGMNALALKHKALLVGGDLSRSRQGVQISITVIGESSKGKVVYRSGARAGDYIYVTGTLGKSAAGLSLLERGVLRGRGSSERDALAAHRRPVPRCDVGFWLAQNHYARAMMDLSDGLSADLWRLCRECRTGAEILLTHIPVFEDSRRWGCSPEETALNGGEDYELVFAADPERVEGLERRYPHTFPKITRIGKLSRKPGVMIRDHPNSPTRRLPERGFDHFRK